METKCIVCWDIYGHHNVANTLFIMDGLGKRAGDAQVIAIIEPNSNSMKLGAHRDVIPEKVNYTDQLVWPKPINLSWDLLGISAIRSGISCLLRGFGALHGKLLEPLK